MRNLLSCISIATIASFAATAYAGGADYNTAAPVFNGLYAGAGIGYGAFSSGSDVSAITSAARSVGISASDSGVVFDAHVGYGFNRYVAAQLEYLFLPRISFSYAGSSSKIYNNMIAFEAKGQYPVMNDKLIPFVTAGYGVILFSTSDDNTSSGSTWEPVIGAGLEYKVNRHLGVNAQYKVVMNVNDEFSTVNMGLAGFNYYF